MTAGHFGFAAVVKSQAPRVPLWALMLSTYLLDVVFIILVATGVENFALLDPAHPAQGQTSIQAYYSHSLLGAALIALIAGLLASWAWGRRAGVVIGTVVISHWFLDLLVHRPDLPILPGNAGNLPLLGFGLWQLPVLSAIIELLLALAGAYLYFQRAEITIISTNQDNRQRNWVLITTGLTGLLTIMLLAADLFNLPIFIALLLMLLLIILCGRLDSRLHWSIATAQMRS